MSDWDKHSTLFRTADRGGKSFIALTPGIQTLVPKRSCSFFLSVQLRLWLTKYPPRIQSSFLLNVVQATCKFAQTLEQKLLKQTLSEQKLFEQNLLGHKLLQQKLLEKVLGLKL